MDMGGFLPGAASHSIKKDPYITNNCRLWTHPLSFCSHRVTPKLATASMLRDLLSGCHFLAVRWPSSYKSQMVVGFWELLWLWGCATLSRRISGVLGVLLWLWGCSTLSRRRTMTLKVCLQSVFILCPTQQILWFLPHQSVCMDDTDFLWETKIMIILLITLLGTRGVGEIRYSTSSGHLTRNMPTGFNYIFGDQTLFFIFIPQRINLFFPLHGNSVSNGRQLSWISTLTQRLSPLCEADLSSCGMDSCFLTGSCFNVSVYFLGYCTQKWAHHSGCYLISAYVGWLSLSIDASTSVIKGNVVSAY